MQLIKYEHPFIETETVSQTDAIREYLQEKDTVQKNKNRVKEEKFKQDSIQMFAGLAAIGLGIALAHLYDKRNKEQAVNNS